VLEETLILSRLLMHSQQTIATIQQNKLLNRASNVANIFKNMVLNSASDVMQTL
jgi:hypothetical protein